MKIINSRLHGILDYVTVLFLLSSPYLFSLPHITSVFAYVLAVVHLTLTLLTRYEVGLVKVIPFSVHGWIELLVSLVLVGVAFYLGTMEGAAARNFYLWLGGVVFIVWLLTDYSNSRGTVSPN